MLLSPIDERMNVFCISRHVAEAEPQPAHDVAAAPTQQPQHDSGNIAVLDGRVRQHAAEQPVEAAHVQQPVKRPICT